MKPDSAAGEGTSVSVPPFPNVNHLWSGFLMETLVRLGLRAAVVSPGSRSTPLTCAAAAHPRVEAVPVLDERSAAFFALGRARATRRPVAVICTSGTAAANWFPAVIEARESRVPLLLLSADRPPEMRECSSGQTIDQLKLFGHYPRWQLELPVPEADPALFRFLRQTLVHAWERCLRFGRGPVHLNLPFRDPLAPAAEPRGLAGLDQSAVWALLDSVREVGPASTTGEPDLEKRMGEWAAVERGVIVAGNECWAVGGEYAEAVGILSKALGWPVLADGLGPLREHAEAVPYLIPNYEWICGAGRVPASPERILRLGPPPTGKRLRAWLAEADCPHWLVDDGDRNIDPLHTAGIPVRCDVRTLAGAMEKALPGGGTASGASAWLNKWLEVSRLGRLRVDAQLEACGFFFEGQISRILSRHLPDGTAVFVANSMPVRDVEWFWEPGSRRREIFFNRGANGIDGTLSTAAGIAASGRPTVLLTGDLALLHDTNGFSHDIGAGSLTVVLINNRGGGIFEHLPIADYEPPFERFFATPQKVDFAKLAEAHEIPHQRVEDAAALRRLAENLPATGVRVWEIQTDRKRDAAFRRGLIRA